MTQKLFHVTNEDGLLSGIHFDPQFQDMRDSGKHPFKISQQAKDNLEQSIKRGKSFTIAGNLSNLALNSENVETTTKP